MNSIEWLQTWYRAQCNDDWEHRYGIVIETLDNPGWRVRIDLTGTPLQDLPMEPVGELASVNHAGLGGDREWLCCRVADNRFEGAGGPLALPRICEVFMDWALLRNSRVH